MTSRGGTAAKGKPGTSQTRASKQRSRGATRGRTADDDDDDDEDYDEDEESDDGATASRTAGSRRATTTAGKSKSLFDPDKTAKADDGNEGVKANDIWSKFVSDDQDVVRAPTAETEYSGTRSSQRSQVTGASGSQGSQRPSQIDEEEEEEESSSDDDRTVYSDYYLPPEYMREEGTPGPRAEIVDSHEACSCFPNRTNKFIGAMLYDKVTCVHTGLVGHTQPGVFKFNPYWNENMEEPRKMRKRDMHIARTKFFFGYPKPKFELVSDSEEDEEDDSDEDSDERESVAPPKTAAKSLKTATATPRTRGRYSDDESDDEDSEYDSDYDYSDDDDDDEEDEDYIPFTLPQIGYPKTPSLPPSSQSFRSRYSDYSESVPESLPSLPATRQLTAQTKRTGVTQRTQRTHFTLPPSRKDAKTAKSGKSGKTVPKSQQKAKSIDSGYDDDVSRRSLVSRQSLPDGPVIGSNRTFQGKFYDPVTKQVMLYDIGTRPGQRIPDGNLEPLNKPPTQASDRKQTPRKDGTSSKPGTKGSQRSRTSQQSHHSVPKAAVLGAVFISNLLSKNKAKKEALEAGYSDEDENK